MKTILLAEDDPFIADIYKTQFKKEGFKVDIAKDGQMVLDKIQNNHPDLLVLDIMLPKIDGLEVLKILRGDKKTKDLKVIIVSNLDTKEYAGHITHMGVLKYFLKIENTPEEFISTIKEILK